MTEKFVQVNVNLTEEDFRCLDTMMRIDAYDNRSAFVRRLIRQEHARRYSKPNPLVTVGEAIAVGNSIHNSSISERKAI